MPGPGESPADPLLRVVALLVAARVHGSELVVAVPSVVALLDLVVLQVDPVAEQVEPVAEQEEDLVERSAHEEVAVDSSHRRSPLIVVSSLLLRRQVPASPRLVEEHHRLKIAWPMAKLILMEMVRPVPLVLQSAVSHSF